MDDPIPNDTMSTKASNELGQRGEQEVQHFFQKHHFGATRMESNDLGIDLRIEVKQPNRKTREVLDLSYIIGCQVKTGNSYFSCEKTQYHGTEATRGVWFRCNQKHYSYWTRSNTRIFLILQREDPDGEPSTDKRYWQWLDNEDLYEPVGQKEDGKNSYKIFVPYTNTVDDSFCSYLIECAYNYRRRQLLSKATTFTFDISQYKTSQHARYALLLPDLVAPHPNRGLDHPISWPEALALVTLHDSSRWTNTFYSFATEYDIVPTLNEAAEYPDPGWRFAAAYYRVLFETDTSELESLSNLPAYLEVARAALLASRAYGQQNYTQAISIIDDATAHISNLSATDKAWLLIHKGNALCELAQWDEALDAFRLSKSLIKDASSDLTAKRILDIATITLFNMEPVTEKGLESLVAARDDELARFSLRRDASALDATFKELFKNWAEPEQITIAASDTLVIKCEIAQETNLLAGDIPAYREALSKLAVIALALRSKSDDRSAQALSSLIRAGDDEHLKQALARIHNTANPRIVSSFVRRLHPNTMTPITAIAYLSAIAIAGDYLDESQTIEWYELLLEVIRDPSLFIARHEKPNAMHSWKKKALECLSAMRYQLSAQQLKEIAYTVAANPSGLETSQGSITNLLERAAEETQESQQLRKLIQDEQLPEWLTRIFNETLGSGDAARDRLALHNEFLSGDATNLYQIKYFNELQPDEMGPLLESSLRALETIAEESDAGHYLRRMTDYGYLAANLLERTSNHEAWPRLITFMEHPLVNNREKLSVAWTIINSIDCIPEETADLMLTHEDGIIRSLGKGQISLSNSDDEKEIINAMFLGLRGRRYGFDKTFTEAFARGMRINQYNVTLLCHVSHPDTVLLELCGSHSSRLALRAFHAFARLCCMDEGYCDTYASMLQDWTMNHGNGFAASLIATATEKKELPASMTVVLNHLANNHLSSAIRYQVRKCLKQRGVR